MGRVFSILRQLANLARIGGTTGSGQRKFERLLDQQVDSSAMASGSTRLRTLAFSYGIRVPDVKPVLATIFHPTRHHLGAGELVQLIDSSLVRIDAEPPK